MKSGIWFRWAHRSRFDHETRNLPNLTRLPRLRLNAGMQFHARRLKIASTEYSGGPQRNSIVPVAADWAAPGEEPGGPHFQIFWAHGEWPLPWQHRPNGTEKEKPLERYVETQPIRTDYPHPSTGAVPPHATSTDP
jgi:hypothetical protein